MKQMRKIFLCGVAVLLSLLMLAACSGELIGDLQDLYDDSESESQSESQSESNSDSIDDEESESSDEEESSSSETEDTTVQQDPPPSELLKGGVYRYRIAVSRSASNDVQAAADKLASKLKRKTGVAIEIVNDVQCDQNESLILIGSTRLQASKNALKKIAANAYTIEFVGNQLVVAGHDDITTQMAVDAFIERVLTKAKMTSNSSGKKNLYLTLDEAVRGEYNLPLEQIADYGAGTYVDTYPCANGVTQKYYINADPSGMDDYIRRLNAGGYFSKEINQIGENRYATCVGKYGMVHLTYLAYNQSLGIIIDPLENHVYKGSEPQYTRLGDNNFAVMSRDYSSQADITDGNGQSYVMTLEDGRYVIIDGGYPECGDDDALYNYMKANNRRADGKIVIAAWIFTHSHGDHYGAFKTFTDNYASMVTVDYFVFNTGTTEMYRQGQHETYLETRFEGIRAQYYSTAKTIKPHTGQILTFANVAFEVLYTQENYAPNLMPWENDSSLVLRIHMDGKSFLIMGDCESNSTGVLCQMYGNLLASDVVQVNHHGYSGGTNELYDLCDPSYALWTTSQPAFDLRVSGKQNIQDNGYKWVSSEAIISNRYIFLKVGVENCFVADGQIEVLTVRNGEFDVTYQTPDFQDRR